MIDPKAFNWQTNRWQEIFLHLENKGFEVYPPNVKVGECIEPYIVVKNDGTQPHPNFSSEVRLYDILIYTPENSYSTLETLIDKVKGSLKELEPLIVFTGSQTPPFFNDLNKSYMVSLSYRNYIKS